MVLRQVFHRFVDRQRIIISQRNTTCSRWLRNNIPWLFSKWELNVLIAYFLKKTKAKRLILNCIFFTQYLVLSWRFLHNQPAACLSKDNYGWEIILLWWSVFQQTTATTDCISKSMVWGNDGEADYEIHVDQQNCHYYFCWSTFGLLGLTMMSAYMGYKTPPFLCTLQ